MSDFHRTNFIVSYSFLFCQGQMNFFDSQKATPTKIKVTSGGMTSGISMPNPKLSEKLSKIIINPKIPIDVIAPFLKFIIGNFVNAFNC